MKKIAIILISFILVGCGSGKSSTHSEIDTSSKKHIGVLSNATVNIYELGGVKKLLFSEKTTAGDTISKIGNFNTHKKSFEAEKFYLFEISGGKNWDIDKNIILDKNPTTNSQIYRAIYKGNKTHVAWWGIKTKGEQKVSE
jgi:hypothetical protein